MREQPQSLAHPASAPTVRSPPARVIAREAKQSGAKTTSIRDVASDGFAARAMTEPEASAAIAPEAHGKPPRGGRGSLPVAAKAGRLPRIFQSGALWRRRLETDAQ